jgi:hypothetical protein
MKNLKDQLSQEELALITGGTTSNGILTENHSNSIAKSAGPACAGSTCKPGCTPGCQGGCTPGCIDATGKNGYNNPT